MQPAYQLYRCRVSMVEIWHEVPAHREVNLGGDGIPRKGAQLRRENAQYGVRMAVDNERPAHSLRIAAELLLPESVADDGEFGSTWRVRFVRHEPSPNRD